MNQSVPRWQKVLLLAIATAAVICAYVFNDRFLGDFWPPDNSRVGPNLVAAAVQALIVAFIAILVSPWIRRRIHRFVDIKLHSVHQQLDKHNAHNEWMARHVAESFRHATGREPGPHPHYDVSAKDR